MKLKFDDVTWRYQSSYPAIQGDSKEVQTPFSQGSNDHTVATNFFLLDIIETKEVLSQHGISTDAMGIPKKNLFTESKWKNASKTTWESHKKKLVTAL